MQTFNQICHIYVTTHSIKSAFEIYEMTLKIHDRHRQKNDAAAKLNVRKCESYHNSTTETKISLNVGEREKRTKVVNLKWKKFLINF